MTPPSAKGDQPEPTLATDTFVPAGRPVFSGRRGDPYAGMAGRRIFVAAPLPDDARSAIADIVARVRISASPGDREVRWVRLDGLHVTLRFLGPTPERGVLQAEAAVRATAAGGQPLHVSLAGSGTFPPVGRPRALWLGIADGTGSLAGLAAALDSELHVRGWPTNGRPFDAHLTLARSDGIAAGFRTAALLAAAMGEMVLTWTLDRIVLYESVTGGGPARYVPLAEAPLGLATG